jgi:hypothetical protein
VCSTGSIPTVATTYRRWRTAMRPHTVDEVQYTPVNALIATMLAASILREVQESLTLEDQDEPSADEQ